MQVHLNGTQNTTLTLLCQQYNLIIYHSFYLGHVYILVLLVCYSIIKKKRITRIQLARVELLMQSVSQDLI